MGVISPGMAVYYPGPPITIRWWEKDDREALHRMQDDPDFVPASRLSQTAPSQVGMYQGRPVFVDYGPGPLGDEKSWARAAREVEEQGKVDADALLAAYDGKG